MGVWSKLMISLGLTNQTWGYHWGTFLGGSETIHGLEMKRDIISRELEWVGITNENMHILHYPIFISVQTEV